VADEGLHEAGDDLDWQESVYFTWRDHNSGMGGNHRIGNEANRKTANLWCGVYRDDGKRFRCNGEDLALEQLDEAGLVAGPQKLFHDGDKLRFLLDGDGCSVDLEIETDTGSLEHTGASAFSGSGGVAGRILSDNFHAFCTARGTATIDGDTAQIEGRGWRDHSWGVRRWDSFLSSRSFGGSCGPFQFRYGSMVGANGSFFRRGSLLRDATALDLESAEMLVSLDDDSVSCRGAELLYRLSDGTTVDVKLEVVGGMIGSTRQRFGWECVGDASVDGETGGWGFLEVNTNPRNGKDPPAYVLHEALVNGVVQLDEPLARKKR
jgi:predicted secreted hydrolase